MEKKLEKVLEEESKSADSLTGTTLCALAETL